MKITSARGYVLEMTKGLQPIIVELETETGLTGIGEASIAFGHGATAVAALIKELVEIYVLGADSRHIEAIWASMYDNSFWTKGGGAISFAAMSSIEQALWDIKGKSLKVPVYELLGGKVRDGVALYANGWCGGKETPLAFANAAQKVVEKGFRALKCYPLARYDDHGKFLYVSHRRVDREFAELAYQKVKSVREAVGQSIEIMIDLSGGLYTDETIRLCQRFEDLDLKFIEEPTDPFDIGALCEVARRVNVPMAVGERIYSRFGFRRVLEQMATHFVQPDIGNTGGIQETRRIAAMAEAYNMQLAPHNSGSPLLTAVCLQVDACTTNFAIQEVFPFHTDDPTYQEFFENPPEREIKNGRYQLNNLPGLGIELDRKAAAPYQCYDLRV